MSKQAIRFVVHLTKVHLNEKPLPWGVEITFKSSGPISMGPRDLERVLIEMMNRKTPITIVLEAQDGN